MIKNINIQTSPQDTESIRKELIEKHPSMEKSILGASDKAIYIANEMVKVSQDERDLFIEFLSKEV